MPNHPSWVTDVNELIRRWNIELSRADFLEALDEMSDIAMLRLAKERESDEDDGP